MKNLSRAFRSACFYLCGSFLATAVFPGAALLLLPGEFYGQSFTKITSGSIVTDGGNSYGAAWGDYDNDGDVDLFVANDIQSNFLYRNNGNGSFTKITSGVIVNDGGRSFGATWGDYDNDGDLDLFVANDDQNNFLYRNDGPPNFTFSKITSGVIVNDGGLSYGAAWGDYDNDGDLDLFVNNKGGTNNFLYSNNGNGTFNKVTSGIIVNDGGNSRAASWGDFDNDRDLDLFVANTGPQNNFLYRNDGPPNFTFSKITTGAIVNDGGNSHGVSWGDYENDGDLDLFVANTANQSNFLYSNNGNGTFTKITTGAIVNDGGSSLGSAWGDFDNDGDLDLFVANDLGSSNFLYSNNGNGSFTKITAGVIVNDGGVSQGAAWADYDNDGDLDMFVANAGNTSNFLYANDGNNNKWINIKLVGMASNRSAIGARVKVQATINGISRSQVQEIAGQTGFGSQNSLNVEFGLGNAAIINMIEITWPSNIVQTITNQSVNQFITVIESATAIDIPQGAIPPRFELAQNYPNPFNPATQIHYQLPKTAKARLAIFNSLGQKVRTLVNGDKPQAAGFYTVEWDGRNDTGERVSSGIYFYRLEAETASQTVVQTRKMILLK